jgi:predicted secreted hydrolase
MESRHDDEAKGSFYLFVQDYSEAQKASRSVLTVNPKDLTVTGVVNLDRAWGSFKLALDSCTVVSHITITY